MSDDDAAVATAAERVLVQQALDGDRSAWQQLMETHAPRLGAYLGARLRRHDVVEKLVGEAIYAAWRHLVEYPQSQDFGQWFRRLGANLAMRWHKKHPGEALAGDFPRDRCEGLSQFEDMNALEQAMGELADNYRMALEQYYRAGLRGSALGSVLHVDAGSAERLVDEALQALNAILESQAEGGGPPG